MKGTCLNSSLNEPVLIILVNEWRYISLHLQAVTIYCSYPGKYHYLDQFSQGKKDSKVGAPIS